MAKKIAGLPNFPTGYKTERRPKKRGKDIIKGDKGLVLHYQNSYLDRVVNPKGTRAVVWIVQTGYPGYTVELYNKPYIKLGWGYKYPNKLAIRLALRGHKTVIIDD
jgi:hypothetical protein